MGSRLKLMVLWGLLITAVFMSGCKVKLPSSKEYCQKLYNNLTKATEVTLGEVFDFSFDRVYFINENYMDGEQFSKEYHLDLNISEVQENVCEEVRRAVFVNQDGDFVYEFDYEYADKLLPLREGIVAYPETKLRLVGFRNGTVKIFELVDAKSFL